MDTNLGCFQRNSIVLNDPGHLGQSSFNSVFHGRRLAQDVKAPPLDEAGRPVARNTNVSDESDALSC